MKLKLLIFLLVIFNFSYLQAQDSPILTILETRHNFGLIKEKDGPVTHNFVFRNTGKATLTINEVNASCGCTTPDWTTDSIMPGQIGYIRVQFDPYNRPGPFSKTLTVNTNADPAITVLFIEGSVAPEIDNPQKEFPVSMGNLRFKNKFVNLGNITNNDIIVKPLEVFNDGKDTIAFLRETLSPPYIKFTFNPPFIAPGETGIVNLIYDVKFKRDLGYSNDNIVLFTDEKENEQKSFNVVAVIEDHFPEFTLAELANEPKLNFEKIIHDFGVINKKQLATTQFIFANNGKKDLKIQKIVSNCNCATAYSETDTIKPGQSSNIIVEFDPSKRVGFEQKTITVFSNDPRNKTQTLTLKATIKE
ncbi:hypothetical protein BH23BAC1_BH23BAC1_16440 [soil metagenome]